MVPGVAVADPFMTVLLDPLEPDGVVATLNVWLAVGSGVGE